MKLPLFILLNFMGDNWFSKLIPSLKSLKQKDQISLF